MTDDEHQDRSQAAAELPIDVDAYRKLSAPAKAERLRDASPSWVAGLARGANLMFCAIVLPTSLRLLGDRSMEIAATGDCRSGSADVRPRARSAGNSHRRCKSRLHGHSCWHSLRACRAFLRLGAAQHNRLAGQSIIRFGCHFLASMA